MLTRRGYVRWSLLLLLLLAWTAPLLGAGDEEKVTSSWGELAVSLRYRLENVSDDNPPVAADDGIASTLRTTILYTTPTWGRFTLFAEVEDVTDLGANTPSASFLL